MKSYIHMLSSLFPTGKIWFSYPAFYSGISLVTGIILAYIFQNKPVIPLYNYYSIYSISLFILFFALIFKNFALRIILFFIIGFFLFTAQNSNITSFLSMIKSKCACSRIQQIEGRLISIPFYTGYFYSFLLSTDKIFTDTDTITMKGKIIKCRSNTAPLPYQCISGQGKFEIPQRQKNPYSYDEYSDLVSNNIWGQFSIESFTPSIQSQSTISGLFQCTRSIVTNTISHIKDRNIKGILYAIFLGDKTFLSTEVKIKFRNAGIYHLLAISGLHVVILITSLMLVLKYIPLSSKLKSVMLLIAIWLYLFFIGLMPSIFRAVIMATIILLSNIVQKNSQVGNSLFVAGILWLILSPISLFSPGFQLSFIATFGIITLFPIFKKMFIPEMKNKPIRVIITAILGSFFVSLSGFIATAPVLIYHFGVLSAFGLIANIFAVLLMSLSMNTFLLSIFFQLFFEKVSIWLSMCTEFFLSMLLSLAEISDYFSYALIKLSLPYTEFFIIFSLLLLLFIFIDKQYIRVYFYWSFLSVFVSSSLVIYAHLLPSYIDILFFNTQHGSVAGLRFPNKKIWLIGSLPVTLFNHPYQKSIAPWMRHSMISNFDAVLLPSLSNNIVHFLDPIVSNDRPNSIITCINKQGDAVSNEIFQHYHRNNNLSHIQVEKGCKIIPSPQCTCTIMENEQERAWYEPEKPAVIKFTLGETTLIFNGEITADSVQFNDSTCLRINNVSVQYKDKDLLYKKIKIYSESQKLRDTHNTALDGAVRIKVTM